MKRFFNPLPLAALILILPALLTGPAAAPAATTNPSPASPGYMVLPVVFDRTVTTGTPVIFRYKLPFPCQVIGIQFAAETIDTSDGDETYSIDVKQGATSILNSAVSIAAAATVYDASVKTATLTDEAVLTGILTVGGTTPSITTISGLLILKRL